MDYQPLPSLFCDFVDVEPSTPQKQPSALLTAEPWAPQPYTEGFTLAALQEQLKAAGRPSLLSHGRHELSDALHHPLLANSELRRTTIDMPDWDLVEALRLLPDDSHEQYRLRRNDRHKPAWDGRRFRDCTTAEHGENIGIFDAATEPLGDCEWVMLHCARSSAQRSGPETMTRILATNAILSDQRGEGGARLGTGIYGGEAKKAAQYRSPTVRDTLVLCLFRCCGNRLCLPDGEGAPANKLRLQDGIDAVRANLSVGWETVLYDPSLLVPIYALRYQRRLSPEEQASKQRIDAFLQKVQSDTSTSTSTGAGAGVRDLQRLERAAQLVEAGTQLTSGHLKQYIIGASIVAHAMGLGDPQSASVNHKCVSEFLQQAHADRQAVLAAAAAAAAPPPPPPPPPCQVCAQRSHKRRTPRKGLPRPHVCQWMGCTRSYTRGNYLRAHQKQKRHRIPTPPPMPQGEGWIVVGSGKNEEDDEEDDDQESYSTSNSARGRVGGGGSLKHPVPVNRLGRKRRQSALSDKASNSESDDGASRSNTTVQRAPKRSRRS